MKIINRGKNVNEISYRRLYSVNVIFFSVKFIRGSRVYVIRFNAVVYIYIYAHNEDGLVNTINEKIDRLRDEKLKRKRYKYLNVIKNKVNFYNLL